MVSYYNFNRLKDIADLTTWSPPKQNSPTLPLGKIVNTELSQMTKAEVFLNGLPIFLRSSRCETLGLTVQMLVVSQGPYPKS